MGRRAGNPDYTESDRQVGKMQQEPPKDFEMHAECSRKAWVVSKGSKLRLLCGGWVVGMPGG